MKDHHKDQLLDALMHYLPMDVRRKVSAEVPVAYEAYCASRQRAVAHATREGDE